MVAATDFVTKLNAAIEAGQSVPDIISADTTKVLNYYPNIPCNDVTDLVDQIDEERPYLQASYEGTKIDDKYYYVPFYSSSTLMFVRKDKLEEAGITEMPTTWMRYLRMRKRSVIRIMIFMDLQLDAEKTMMTMRTQSDSTCGMKEDICLMKTEM